MFPPSSLLLFLLFSLLHPLNSISISYPKPTRPQHGHNFYVLTTYESTIGWGSYNPFEDPFPPGLDPSPNPNPNTNPSNPSSDEYIPHDLTRAVVLRDTVQIPRRGHAVLRFRADNPGVWLFHCHILWHLASGMAMLVDVMGDAAGAEAHDPSWNNGEVGGMCRV